MLSVVDHMSASRSDKKINLLSVAEHKSASTSDEKGHECKDHKSRYQQKRRKYVECGGSQICEHKRRKEHVITSQNNSQRSFLRLLNRIKDSRRYIMHT